MNKMQGLKLWIAISIGLIGLNIVFAQELNTVVEMLDRLDSRIDNLAGKQKKDIQGLEKKLEKSVDTLSSQLESVQSETNSRNEGVELLAMDLTNVTGELRKVIEEKKVEEKKSGPVTPKSFSSKKEIESKPYPLAKLKPAAKGFMYYHLDASEGEDYANSFDISRMYIGGKYQINDDFMARYLTDIGHQSKTGKFEVFTKYAYLDWKTPVKGLNLIMGLQGTSNWKAPEKAWGLRGVRKAPFESFGGYLKGQVGDFLEDLEAQSLKLADTTGGNSPSTGELEKAADLKAFEEVLFQSARNLVGSSADLGIGGKFKRGTSYLHLMVRNGTGYKKTDDDRYKNFQLRVGKKFMDKKLHLSGFAEAEPWQHENSDGDKSSYMNLAWDLLAEYKLSQGHKMGANVAEKKFEGSSASLYSRSYSVFGQYKIIPKKLTALARVDYYDTGLNDLARDLELGKINSNSTLVILGFNYSPVKNIQIVPNYQISLYEKKGMDPTRNVYIHLLMKI